MVVPNPVRRAVPAAALALSAVLAAGAGPAAAQAPDLLVSAAWVEGRLGDEDVVLLHVGPEEAYAAEHLPGAVFVGRDVYSHPDSHSPESLILELPEPNALQEALRALGVHDDSRIVVYWGEEWVTPTARLVFTLDWAGLGDRTSLLDGGLTAWKAAGYAVSSEPAAPGRGDVTVRPRPELIVDAAWVEAHTADEGLKVIDARAAAFFDGVREDRGVAGHIPGAGSVPWTELIDEETLRLHPPERLRELLSEAGVAPGDRVVGYCHIGQYATLALFSARLLGHEVALYDGAFQDWARRGLPVTSGR